MCVCARVPVCHCVCVSPRAAQVPTLSQHPPPHLAIFPSGAGRWRLLGRVPDPRPGHPARRQPQQQALRRQRAGAAGSARSERGSRPPGAPRRPRAGRGRGARKSRLRAQTPPGLARRRPRAPTRSLTLRPLPAPPPPPRGPHRWSRCARGRRCLSAGWLRARRAGRRHGRVLEELAGQRRG